MTNENLAAEAANTKIKELAEAIDFAMLCTDLGAKRFHAIPMSTKRVDEDGAIWFLSRRDSTHNKNINADPKVELLYSDPASMRFLAVYGEALITSDRVALRSLYGKTDDCWFDGLEDPNLTAIKISPIDGLYWDTKSNKLIALFKMGVAATSEKQYISQHGDLNV